MPPVALPFTLSGFTSLMMLYGIMAAPDPIPKMNIPTFAESGSGLNAIWTAARIMTTALPIITGFRRPIRSESQPTSGHPTTQPRGTMEAVTTALW